MFSLRLHIITFYRNILQSAHHPCSTVAYQKNAAKCTQLPSLLLTIAYHYFSFLQCAHHTCQLLLAMGKAGQTVAGGLNILWLIGIFPFPSNNIWVVVHAYERSLVVISSMWSNQVSVILHTPLSRAAFLSRYHEKLSLSPRAYCTRHVLLINTAQRLPGIRPVFNFIHATISLYLFAIYQIIWYAHNATSFVTRMTPGSSSMIDKLCS